MIINLSNPVNVTFRVSREAVNPTLVTARPTISNLEELPVEHEVLRSTESVLLIALDTSNLWAGQFSIKVEDSEGVLIEQICSFRTPQQINDYKHEYKRSEYRN